MTMARALLVAVSILFSVAIVTPAIAGITPEQKCASAKMRAVGKKQGAKAKCYAKALSQSAAVVAECLTLAESKFDAAFTSAEAPGGCLHVGDASTIESKIDQALSDIVGDLGCGNGTTEGDEQCDDANLVDGDSCSSTCTTPTCGGIGEACVVSDDCCSNNCNAASLTCNAPTCTADGGSCTGNLDCCSNVCNPPTLTCTAPSCSGTGETCAVSDDCCSNNCNAATLICSAPSCTADGGSCTGGDDCCSNNCSAASLTCIP
jgi:cysteine-rich repeat protein